MLIAGRSFAMHELCYVTHSYVTFVLGWSFGAFWGGKWRQVAVARRRRPPLTAVSDGGVISEQSTASSPYSEPLEQQRTTSQ